MNDLPGYLDAFGSPCRVKGFEYLGILEDDYQQVEMGRVRVSSNAPQIRFTQADVRKMALALNDQVEVQSPELGTWSTYIVRSIQPGTDGFSLIICIEST